MRITDIRIQNYRAIKDCSFSLEALSCIIGENNSGKSSILLAISNFFTGTKLSASDFYNEGEQIRIEMTISDITFGDLNRLHENHRNEIEDLIIDGKLSLIRVYQTNGSSQEFLTRKLMPIDDRFNEEEISNILKGKKGKEIVHSLTEHLPEYAEKFESITTQGGGKEVVKAIISEMSDEELELKDAPLPTGFSNTVKNLLPEPVLIPAVLDATDEVKTKDSATFGKLIGILLKLIEEAEEVKEIVSSFNELKVLLNRQIGDDGEVIDNRLNKVKEIEDIIGGYLKENFPRVQLELEIPPPELKQVFSTAKILLDDGVKDLVETKGDGLKRAVTFALLRSFSELRKSNKADDSIEEKQIDRPYLFLFEEPELYLHPAAQKVMFDALSRIAVEHQVIVTTHSPLFFSPTATGTFIKLIRKFNDGERPFGHAIAINLIKDISARDAFQLICFENSSAAFFASKVVLVEGDSDWCFLRHLAKLFREEWDFDNKNVPIVRISGKGNLKRFKEFFEIFEIEVHAILDLDALLKDFDKLETTDDMKNVRQELINEIDQVIEEEELEISLESKKIMSLVKSYSFRQRYERLKEIFQVARDRGLTKEELIEFELLFIEEVNQKRKTVLVRGTPLLQKKDDLINSLRTNRIHVLLKGELENYYPAEVNGSDKATRALNACNIIKSCEQVKPICPVVNNNGEDMSEFEFIFLCIF